MSPEDKELLDAVKANHEGVRAFYEHFGFGELFKEKFWDGFDTFEDYFMYGDMFPFLKIEDKPD